MGEAGGTYGERRDAYWVMVGKRQLGTSRRRREVNIKIRLQEMG